MTAKIATSHKLLATTLIKAAKGYWLHVYPRICRESHHWRQRAEQIPDPVLRRLALEAQQIKRGNVEGSAAFAAFAPTAHRGEVVRAQVAFQSAYDYVDTLSEQPNNDPIANGHQLHQALLAAVDEKTGHSNYYARYPCNNDGGYLEHIIDACRSALGTLPSRNAITDPAHRITERIVAYQSLNLSQPQGGHRHLERWALKETPPATNLKWWETAASAGSSLGLFALIAVAAHPTVRPTDATAIENAYWPWIGALHSLLDSLIDKPEDTAAAQRSLLDYYGTPQETARRLQLLTSEALRAINLLPLAHEHTLVLAGMTGFYLTAPEASSTSGQLVSQGICNTVGAITRPCMAVFTIRRAAGRVLDTHTAPGRIPRRR